MSADSSDIPAPDPEHEPAELASFREQWKAELRQRRTATSGIQTQPGASASASTTAERAVSPARSDTSTKTATISNTHPALRGLPRPATHSIAGAPNVPVLASHGQSHLSPTLAHAVEVYRNAVLHEQQSQLDEALRLYRQAFRLDPNVDRAYFKEHELSAASPAGHKKTSCATKIESATRGAQKLSVDKDDKDKPHVTSEFLAQVIKSFPEHLVFEPEDEKGGPPSVNLIPDELLLKVLRTLDYTTVERFATVSRKARMLSLDSAIWRDFVHLAYKPPQIPDDESLTDIVKQYGSDYRRVYVEHPRLRLDGVYIAVCHYVRMGSSENAWVNITHLITYHRYLRFFPNGQVLSLLANEEWQPQIVIPMLKPTLRMKGFYIGDWSLSDGTVYITNLTEKHPVPAHSTGELQQGKYVFQMTLALRSRPLGRWNKLDFIGYDSVNVEDGEAISLPLKHERSFWFSRVRSWAGYH
ncbi:hypothetical protein K503DRAFT_772811 [Rhizopogon vinicolor AM-OR11-026]|uniref:F-box domain-containing protein n=1 Tax=Rhizopogon vinicolor AM-OR11-026 TaxID=1314800 RepID=A0A1B7MU48_9AGAM|nr:hypothetical protein K503DRAFT_772811 [Rhizopogon vinicolor AM-OR11-026]